MKVQEAADKLTEIIYLGRHEPWFTGLDTGKVDKQDCINVYWHGDKEPEFNETFEGFPIVLEKMEKIVAEEKLK